MFLVTDLMGKTPHETIVNDVKGVRNTVAGITSAGKAGDAIVGVVGYPGCNTVTDYLVTEVCPYCESEIEMRWNVKEQGYKAICPVCGNRLIRWCKALRNDWWAKHTRQESQEVVCVSEDVALCPKAAEA